MNNSITTQGIVNNEFDFSNIIPTVDAISYLIQYCYKMNEQLTKLVSDDEEKNKQFKSEYKNYLYKKSYGQLFEIYICNSSFNSITCKDFDSFKSAVSGGNLDSVNNLSIKLYLNFYRGSGDYTEEYENYFTIIFKPYDIKFIRKSNHIDSSMDQIEQQIINILNKFPVINSIFCNKDK